MKKKILSVLMLLLVTAVLLNSGCATANDQNSTASKTVSSEEAKTAEISEIDDTSHATPKGEGWLINVSGARADEVWESNFEKWKEDPASGYGEFQFERKGEMLTVTAMPLVKIVAMVDDADATMPYSFKDNLWNSGYDLTLTAADGYSATINTADHAADEIYIADSVNGEKIKPMSCGNVSGQLWVKELSEITASIEAVSLENNDFELILEIGEQSGSYKISELEKLNYYIEDKGNYTNSYGNTFESTWAGVKIVDLINEYTNLTADMSITIEAMDGYAMNYSGEQLLDNSNGDWILAFMENGEYMPEDPGYIRLVKVGPENPNFTGHVSARMVKKIIIKDIPFKNFNLSLVSTSGTEVMDAQTLMSGVTNSRTVVEMWNKKKTKLKDYMGMPIYMLLERYSGYETVKIEASDGYTIALAASELDGNNDVIIGMFKGDGSDLDEDEFPLVVAWDNDAALVPDGIKAVRNVVKIILE